MKVDIMTRSQVTKLVAEEVAKKEKVYCDKIDRLYHKVFKLEEELKVWTGKIKLPGKNQT